MSVLIFDSQQVDYCDMVWDKGENPFFFDKRGANKKRTFVLCKSLL